MELLAAKDNTVLNNDSNNVLIKYQIPFEIKNDIIYCQKALRTYLKVHQMVFSHFGQKLITALPAVRVLLDDLEREIYEINAEQRFLIYRLRKSLEEFYKSLSLSNIIIDRDADNTFLRHSFSKYVDDPNYPCEAITVKTRRSFNQWKRKFTLDDPKKAFNDSKVSNTNNTLNCKTPQTLTNGFNSVINGGLQTKQQVSLLKPKCERDLVRLTESDQSMEIKHENFDIDHEISSSLSNDRNSNEFMEVEEKLEIDKIDNKCEEESSVSLKPSPAMNIGRMKLLLALNKAKSQKEVTPSLTQTVTSNKSSVPPIKSVQTSLEQQKPVNKVVEVSTSSDDSLDGINTLPQIEPEKPEIFQLNQEMFLRQFGLYTLQHTAYLKQRRSKRRRRNVQFNERKDFHYGNLNLTAIDAQTGVYPKEKKKKIFLASPTVARKTNKRNRNNKDEIVNNKMNQKSDRSSTSSPNEKSFCNVCFRNNESTNLSSCNKCKQNFHISCHSKYGIKTGSNRIKKMCPICICAKKSSRSASSEECRQNNNASTNNLGENKVRRSSLIDQCNLLKQKIVSAKMRQNNLLKESEAYKTKMSEFFNIVDSIKSQNAHIVTKTEPIIVEILSSDDDENYNNDDSNFKHSSSFLNSLHDLEKAKKESFMLKTERGRKEVY